MEAGRMPKSGKLSAPEIAQIMAYLKTVDPSF